MIIFLMASILLVSSLTPAYAHENSGSSLTNITPHHVVGIWIEVDGGDSNWATFYETTNSVYTWSYNTQGKRWRMHLGLGGTPQNWRFKRISPWYSGDADLAVTWGGLPYYATTWDRN